MQPLQICIGPIIRIGRESWCLPYAGFFILYSQHQDILIVNHVLPLLHIFQFFPIPGDIKDFPGILMKHEF